MNISLTTLCNNHCPYCFQEDWRKHEKCKELPFDDFIKILDWLKNSKYPVNKIGLLGGEPTIYSHFADAIKILSEQFPEKELVIFTNLLCKQSDLDLILNSNCAGLINCTYDDDKRERFEQNIEYFAFKARTLNKFNKFNIGITLYENRQQSRMYIDRALDLIVRYNLNPILRVGLATPNSGLKIPKIENYDSELLYLCEQLKIIDQNTGHHIKICFDCPSNFCAFSTVAHNIIQQEFSGYIAKELFKCVVPALDVLPDLSVVYCASSGNAWKLPNLFEYDDYGDVLRTFIETNKNYQFKNENCLNCSLYKSICYPCHCVDNSLCGGC